MYLEERPETCVSTDIPVSPSTLWPLVSDIGTPARFSDELQSAAWLLGASCVVGATFVGRNSSRRGYQWETHPTVSRLEEPFLFEWTVGELLNPIATWSFELAETPSGSTLTHRVIFGPGGSPLRDAVLSDPLSAHSVVDARLGELRSSMQKVIEGIRALAISLT